MNQLERFEEIDAPPETVWSVVLEPEYGTRRTALDRSLEAVPVVGDRLRADRPPTRIGRAVFELELRIAEENRRLVRLDRVSVPRVLDSHHDVSPRADRRRKTDEAPPARDREGRARPRTVRRATARTGVRGLREIRERSESRTRA
ncbi:polyketide cyclase/dehydrase [Natronococcus occultus]|uniref:polyketide cyclase/dehydrase n=1 Tax=Natronococcus occultus TaxID=29288 RepID=UPI001FDF6D90|nr:polyketide cyclase/dehydrase [Natronococcus occultus]